MSGSWSDLGWALAGSLLTILAQYAWKLYRSLGHKANFRIPPEVDPGPDYGLMRQLDVIRNARFGHLRVIKGSKGEESVKKEDE